jgi:hypothetical protein
MELAFDEDDATRLVVASNPRTPAYSLRILAKDGSPDVVAAVQENPSRPDDLRSPFMEDQMDLAKNEDPEVRLELACRDDLSPAVLTLLAADTDHRIRSQVAMNPECDSLVLADLISDGEWEVRACAAKNRATPPLQLALVATDMSEEIEVRAAARENPMCPPEAAEISSLVAPF